MMMAENTTDGKLERLLNAATDLFDFVQRSAEKGMAIHEAEEGIWQRMLQMGHDALGQFLERLQLLEEESCSDALRRISGCGLSDCQRRDRGRVSLCGEGPNGTCGNALDRGRSAGHAGAANHLHQWPVEGFSNVSHPTRTTTTLPSTKVAKASNLAFGCIERKTGYTQTIQPPSCNSSMFGSVANFILLSM